MSNPKADASLYLLTGLFQRLELERPGMIQEMIEGVEGDKASLPSDVGNRAYVEEVFDEALTLLKRANNTQ
ncbi:hypothetical protein [Halomonas caseinilytica]|uniref:Uncharacterized protein n=1 Tax=Halomonas caseinilytica TaxID=438744 RepID=A0A1M6MWM4_9GAMM|nr:hypothetical protein [Halomonas caseinilytica]SHJ87790.1 hypothetical protein SAMN05192556_101189 [Halomonas caseinilytica]